MLRYSFIVFGYAMPVNLITHMVNFPGIRDRLFRLIVLAILVALSSGCDSYSHLNEIKERGELRILTRNAPTSYFENADGQYEGLEHEMATDFASYLGVKPVFVIKNSAAELLEALNRGEADVIAAGLTRTQQREASYLFGPVYQQVEQQMICRRNNGGIPRSLADMKGRNLWVSANTSYEQQMHENVEYYSDISWTSNGDLGTEELLEMVWKRKIECTVSDSNIFAINRRYYPELVMAFALTEPQDLSWVMPKESEDLAITMESWFKGFEERDQMAILLERYYGYVDAEYDYVDTREFHRAINRKLPKYRNWFEQSAKQYELDWLLLAAVSYQESHWNARAKSPTGVRGIMMITLPTARHLGLENRLDPKASIFAGAKYLSQLRARIPEHIEEPQRTWMALTAYNMGFGHFRDAQALARKLDKDPDRWDHFESVLPLLSRKKYYSQLKHGYARGGQALHYVTKVRDYRDQLSRFLQPAKESKE